MTGHELTLLIQQRWSALHELLRISHRQMAAINAGQMSDLMRLLSEKQRPLNQLAEIAASLREAVNDDPRTRVWESEQAREACRQQQEECEKMHLDLLAMEAESETTLQENRDLIQERIDRVDAGWQAASGYANSAPPQTCGGKLDLSSD